ncbi:255_t:CDS:2, partial [Paraglomus occultum]
TYYEDATFYNPGLGAYGDENSDSDFIAALAGQDFDPFTPNQNPNKTDCVEAKLKSNLTKNLVLNKENFLPSPSTTFSNAPFTIQTLIDALQVQYNEYSIAVTNIQKNKALYLAGEILLKLKIDHKRHRNFRISNDFPRKARAFYRLAQLKMSFGFGSVDYTVVLDDIIICVTEAKKMDFDKGAAQNIVQMHSAVENLRKRKLEDVDLEDSEESSSYGVWNRVKCSKLAIFAMGRHGKRSSPIHI